MGMKGKKLPVKMKVLFVSNSRVLKPATASHLGTSQEFKLKRLNSYMDEVLFLLCLSVTCA